MDPSDRIISLGLSEIEDLAPILEAVFAHSSDGIAFVDSSLTIRAANHVYSRHVGMPLSRIVGSPVEDAIPDWTDRVIEVFQKVRVTGQACDVDMRPAKLGDTLPGGEARWASTVSPIRAPGYAFRGYLLVIREPGGREAVEEEARRRAEAERERLLLEVDEARSRFQAVVEHAPIGIAVCRGYDLVYEVINSAYQAIAPGKQLLGRTVAAAWPEIADEYVPLLRDVLETGRIYQATDVFIPIKRSPDGPLVDAYFTISFVPLPPDGSGEGAVSILAIETTEQVRARQGVEELAQQAWESLAELEAVMNSMTEGLIVSDLNGRVLTMNREALRLHGYEDLEEARRRLPQFVDTFELRYLHGTVIPIEEWPLSRVLRGDGVSGLEVRVRNLRTSSAAIWSYSGRLVRNRAGDAILTVITVHDVTGQKQAEAKMERLLAAEQEARSLAERAVRVRDEFISVAAHELKTPVTSLQGFSQLLLRLAEKNDGQLDGQAVLRSARRIVGQSQRLTKLTEQLLNLSRLESGKLVLRPEITQLASLAKHLVASMQHAHPDRSIAVHEQDEVTIYADVVRLEQVLANLIDNALKFSPRESPVEVEVSNDAEGWARISVRDYGTGIPEEERDHIFERFYQAHAWQHYGGMGIGLFVSREIVEMHGGSITVEQPEGVGSRFVVRLPASGDEGSRPT